MRHLEINSNRMLQNSCFCLNSFLTLITMKEKDELQTTIFLI